MNLKALPGVALLLFVSVMHTPAATAQSNTNNYTQTNLVSNVPGLALNADRSFVHPWGLAVSPGQAFRVPVNSAGNYWSFDATGAFAHPFIANVAGPPGSAGAGPTGVAANTTGLFIPPGSLSSPFIFATQQGTISGEYADSQGNILATTILTVDNSSRGAEYTGLAVPTPSSFGPYLAVADFHRGYIDTYTSLFAPLGIPGAFTDPSLPSGYAPWNIQVAGTHVFVAYALQDSTQRSPIVGAGNGIVDEFNLDGSFLRRFASNGPLNVPSGIVQAGANFGAFSNDILIANYGDGLINAFDPSTGQLLGPLKDGNGNAIVNPDLHAITFGDGVTGNANTLYLTAALAGGTNGLFAAIAVNTSGAGPDFSLHATPGSVTVSLGQTAAFSITAAPIANFRSAFTFTCNAPSTITCTVGSSSVDPATGAATVNINAATSSATRMGVLALPALLLAGLGLGRRRRFAFPAVLAIAALALAAGGITGCSVSNGGMGMQPQTGPQSLSVTATAGAVSHTTMLTVNIQ